jgi:hypothetical protein
VELERYEDAMRVLGWLPGERTARDEFLCSIANAGLGRKTEARACHGRGVAALTALPTISPEDRRLKARSESLLRN